MQTTIFARSQLEVFTHEGLNRVRSTPLGMSCIPGRLKLRSAREFFMRELSTITTAWMLLSREWVNRTTALPTRSNSSKSPYTQVCSSTRSHDAVASSGPATSDTLSCSFFQPEPALRTPTIIGLLVKRHINAADNASKLS